jgi:hypothetical protein
LDGAELAVPAAAAAAARPAAEMVRMSAVRRIGLLSYCYCPL